MWGQWGGVCTTVDNISWALLSVDNIFSMQLDNKHFAHFHQQKNSMTSVGVIFD